MEGGTDTEEDGKQRRINLENFNESKKKKKSQVLAIHRANLPPRGRFAQKR